MNEPLIQCENLVKIYSTRRTGIQKGVEVVALQGLDLSVGQGEMIGIVGESGSGKSTLLNILGGLDKPSAGKALVGEADLLLMNEKELNEYRLSRVGFVWQQTTRNLTPYLSALENVMLPMRLKHGSEEENHQRAMQLLKMCGIVERASHIPAQLSGGEQQRVAIAVALANQPALLLADEPTGELDSVTAEMIYGVLEKVNRQLGTTMIIVSHDAGISRHVGRVVLIRDGKTSTETVRVAPEAENTTEMNSAVRKERAGFEELLMLDNAGRLQLPAAMLEELNIGGRVRAEKTADGILLRGVSGHEHKKATVEDEDDAVFVYLQEDAPEEEKTNLRNWLKGFWAGGRR